jgi:hypothetical protein
VRRFALALSIVAAGIILLPSGPAAAHDSSNWYTHWWHSSDLTNNKVTWSFSPGFWNGQAYRDRVIDGSLAWNALNGNRSFDRQADSSQDPNGPADCASQFGNSKVWKGGISGGALAVTGVCWVPGTTRLKSFQMKFNENINWYTGDGSPGASQYDLWSVASHEMGHAMGQHDGGPLDNGHWDEQGYPNTSLCDYSDYPTHVMCYSLSPGKVTNSPREHDRHTFNDRY